MAGGPVHSVVAQSCWRGHEQSVRVLGAASGIALRVAMGLMLREVLKAGSADHRFAAKGIRSRALLVVPAACVAMPLLWRRGKWASYPFWMDDLFLSIVALDLAGNVFDLYDRYERFDLIPHAHGTGALTVLVAWLPGLSMWSAVGIATAGHVLLEAQETASDVLFGYRNVRGSWDTIGDLAAGAIGTAVYGGLYHRFVRRAGREPRSPRANRR
ncbi:MAG: hypothetical protein C0498_06455 [Anaerolinea sp.]|nr:hypothetical protein [Anaerolinea sp.]